jgi:hypothetical protein
MTKSQKRLDTALNNQLDIFEVIRRMSDVQRAASGQADTPGRLNIDATLREMVSDALKHTRLSRYEVGAEMSKLIGREITKGMIDSWSAESKENHRFPLAYLPAFCEAVGDKSIIRLIAEKAGGYFIEGEEALYTELGKLERMKKEISEKEKLIKQMLEKVRR